MVLIVIHFGSLVFNQLLKHFANYVNYMMDTSYVMMHQVSDSFFLLKKM